MSAACPSFSRHKKKKKVMLLVAALPVADVLKAAVSRRSLSVRLLVLIACLAACRRGRAVMSYAVWKVGYLVLLGSEGELDPQGIV